MYSIVYVTAPDDNVASTLAHALVSQKLAACVQRIAQVKSVFTWDGKVDEATEVLLLIKTETRLVEQITQLVLAKHPYAVPEVVAHPLSAQGNPAYLQWVSASVAPPPVLNAAVVSAANAAALRPQYEAAQPFPVMRVRDAFSQSFLEDVFDTLAAHGNFEPRSNDLYMFSQSEDLREIGARAPVIQQLAQHLYSDAMLGFVSGVTGIALNNQVDMSATLYTKGCHLLTHDDRETTRRVAFILYLTPKAWSDADGGHLRCYYSDPLTRMPDPHRYVQFLPEWSTLAFFTVGPQSFHSVEEVTSAMPRVAVSGWFHGDALAVPQLAPVLFPPLQPAAAIVDDGKAVARLVSDVYGTPSPELERKMRRRGAIACAGFFRQPPDQQQLLLDQPWVDVGPLHIRYYQRCANPTGAFKAVRDFLCGSSFLEWAQRLIGVHLRLASVELRRFARGRHYTLLHDPLEGAEQQPSGGATVEAVWCMSHPSADGQWDTDHGGYLCHIDSSDGSELQTAVPLSNCLSLTLMEPGVVSFVKFLSSYAPSDRVDAVVRFDVTGEMPGLQHDDDDDDDEEEDEEEDEDDDEEGEGEDEDDGAGQADAGEADKKRRRKA